MLKTAQDLDITTDSPETIAAIDTFSERALCYGKEVESLLLQGIAADPTCAIVRAYAAAYYLSQESQAGRQQAIPHLRAAQQFADRTSEGEQLYIQAIAAWAEGEINQAIALHEAIAQKFPRDLISVQQGQYHYFYQGDKAGLLRIAQTVLPANPENPYLHGMIAFGLEQCHQLETAEQWGRRATEMQRQNPWAHHAVAHVLEMQGRVDEGIAWMESLANTWESCNSMLYTHNWWHIALYYLAKQDAQGVLKLYDQKVWGRARKDSPKDQVGAIALLLRLELQGIDVGKSRWQALALYLLPRLHEHALPFQDLHYLYALTRAGRLSWVREMLNSMEVHIQTLHPEAQSPWLKVALPAARGIIDHAKGHWQEAIDHLQPVLPQLWRIGGSHAQRQLFQQIYRDAVRHQEQRHQKRAQPRLLPHSRIAIAR